ncbi:MAG: hypothetical protein JW917_03720 [Ignavibacteria bacterium]|nr:hypothetical protein [Ignavibacteria bacterium]
MSREKILLTVLTYPQPSLSYEENFCTAGFREDGSMIRLYPLAFSRYSDLHKYSFIEINIQNRKKGDFRPESYSPKDFYLKDLKVLGKLDSKNSWAERKKYCLKNVYTDFNKLIKDSKEPRNVSLAVFKPNKIMDFVIENTEREWKSDWLEKMKQGKLFEKANNKIILKKLPYNFKYKIADSNNKVHKLSILDWEIGALYWNCLKRVNGNETQALEKVREKYFKDFLKKDVYFFVGTTLEWHLRRAKNPFTIIGVFYPPKPAISVTSLLFQ